MAALKDGLIRLCREHIPLGNHPSAERWGTQQALRQWLHGVTPSERPDLTLQPTICVPHLNPVP